MEEMNNSETIKICVEEFSRVQQWMLMTGKDTDVYKAMKTRYRDLKVILAAMGVNVTTLDVINEQYAVRGADNAKGLLFYSAYYNLHLKNVK